MRQYVIGILLAAWLPACTRKPAEPPRLVAAEIAFVRALEAASARPELLTLEPEESGRRLAEALAPARRRLAELAPEWRRLDDQARRDTMQKAERACASELKRFYRQLAALSDRYRQPAARARFRPALRAALGPFEQTGTLWAFEIFSRDAVEELEEMMEEDEG
jgi:hypothetical protein